MTQEEKELLLKDLCARFPYNTKVEITFASTGIKIKKLDAIALGVVKGIANGYITDTVIKPYLFPLSNMSDEQKRELRQMNAFISIFGYICFETCDEYGHDIVTKYEDVICITDWLNKNHFDIYGLIPKGLAIDATGLNIYSYG